MSLSLTFPFDPLRAPGWQAVIRAMELLSEEQFDRAVIQNSNIVKGEWWRAE